MPRRVDGPRRVRAGQAGGLDGLRGCTVTGIFLGFRLQRQPENIIELLGLCSPDGRLRKLVGPSGWAWTARRSVMGLTA